MRLNKIKYHIFISSLLMFLMSCKGYKQNIMLQTPEGYAIDEINKKSWESNRQYVIQANDLLSVEVYSNKGERIIDPDFELMNEMNTGQMSGKPEIQYQVSKEGFIKLPMVGEVQMDGQNLRAAELTIEEKYKQYYNAPFAYVTFLNKRVTVIGEVNKVIPLTNENTHLIEVLALADAVTNNSKVQNIRLVRQDDVFVLDLSKIEGLKQANMMVQPGDIIYIEPVRRPFVESIRDYGPVIGIVTSLTAIVAILTR